MIWIIDAHTEYQAGLNVPSLVREGYSALVVKATQGATGYTAPGRFDTWRQQARDSGMIFGAYHWLTSADPVAQVNHFLGRIGDPTGMLIQLDVEDTANPPSWATISGWANEWNRRTGNHPFMLYTGAWWWNVAGRKWNGASLTPYLWNSHYVSGVGYASALFSKVPASWWTPSYGGWSTCTVLQFSSNGSAGGLTGNVDVNAFSGTMNDLRALARLGQVPQSQGDSTQEVFDVGALSDDQIRRLYTMVVRLEAGLGALMRGVSLPAYDDNFMGIRNGILPYENFIGPAILNPQPEPVNINVSDPDVVHAIAVEVAGLLAPQFKDVADVKKALGDLGDGAASLGKLNDE